MGINKYPSPIGPRLENMLLIRSVPQGDLHSGSLQLFAHIHQSPSDSGLDTVSLTPASELLEARGFILLLCLSPDSGRVPYSLKDE